MFLFTRTEHTGWIGKLSALYSSGPFFDFRPEYWMYKESLVFSQSYSSDGEIEHLNAPRHTLVSEIFTLTKRNWTIVIWNLRPLCFYKVLH